ncbi:MAG: hypothetical protein ABI548_22145 [Polyangiaceae bacterium]
MVVAIARGSVAAAAMIFVGPAFVNSAIDHLQVVAPLSATGGSSAGGQATTQGDNSSGGSSGAGAAGTAGADGVSVPLRARPPMGWESWWSNHTNVETDADVRAVADVVASKFAALGYEYLLI